MAFHGDRASGEGEDSREQEICAGLHEWQEIRIFVAKENKL